MTLYAAGVSGAQASTIYPCGHMAYYDSGYAPPMICPTCGARHQNAALMQQNQYKQYNQTVATANTTAINQITYVMEPASKTEPASPLVWLDNELGRYIKP